MQLRTPEPRSSAPLRTVQFRPDDRVLVVNDDAAQRDETVRTLQEGGIEALGVDCPLGAIDDGPFDLVVVAASADGALLDLVRDVRDKQLVGSRQGADGCLQGPRGLRLSSRMREVSLDGRSVALSPRESDVLRALLERQNDVLSTDEIAVTVWGHETFGSPNFVEAQISRLRSKLSMIGAADVMQTVRGEGYVISETLLG